MLRRVRRAVDGESLAILTTGADRIPYLRPIVNGSRSEAPPMLSSEVRFRRQLAGISLIGATVTLLASELVIPAQGDGNAELLAAVHRDPTEWLVADLLLLVSTILFVPAILGVVHLVRARVPLLGTLAGGFAVLGVLGHMGFVTYGLVVYEAAGVPERDEMVELLDRLDGGASVVLLPMILSFGIGLLLMAIALYRAHAAPRWVMLAVIAAFVLEVGAPGTSVIAAAIKQGLAVIAFGYVGARVLRMPDSDWLGRTKADTGDLSVDDRVS
jgi:hypothetical protein